MIGMFNYTVGMVILSLLIVMKVFPESITKANINWETRIFTTIVMDYTLNYNPFVFYTLV